ncbi:MAG: hypothetical protein H0W53_18665 [Acidobacteria bacterium]|nr:hypothetical protein [Acidobacteriota bacterium]
MFMSLQALTISVALLAPVQPPAAPQGSSSPPSGQTAETQAPVDTISWPVSLDRIQEAISRPPAIKTPAGRPTFRVEVIAKKPTIEDILGKGYLVGPTPGPMTHQEFLNMVTPNEFRGMGVFTGGEALTVAATSIGLQWALSKAIDKLAAAKTERAKDAARREVLDAMNQLAEARKKAGLPPK